MSTFKILSTLFKLRRDIKRYGFLDAVFRIFRPEIRQFERNAKNAVGDIAYLEYEAKSIQYDLEKLNEKKERLNIELENLSKSINQFKQNLAHS